MKSEAKEGALVRRIAPVARQLRHASDEMLAELGVSSSAGWCLMSLARMGADSRQTDLAEQLGITQPSLVRTLHQLQSAGLVGRVPHPSDKRSNRLALTPAGEELAGRIEQRLADLHRDLLKGVPDAAIDIMANLLDLLSQRIAARRGAASAEE